MTSILFLFAAVSPTEKITGATAFAFQNLETIKHRFADFQTKVNLTLLDAGAMLLSLNFFLMVGYSRSRPTYVLV